VKSEGYFSPGIPIGHIRIHSKTEIEIFSSDSNNFKIVKGCF